MLKIVFVGTRGPDLVEKYWRLGFCRIQLARFRINDLIG